MSFNPLIGHQMKNLLSVCVFQNKFLKHNMLKEKQPFISWKKVQISNGARKKLIQTTENKQMANK